MAVIGSLSMRGWISDPASVLDQLLLDAWSAEFEQSDMFYGDVTSVSHVYQQYAGQPEAFGTFLSDYLTRYLVKFFDNVNVIVTISYPEDSDNTYVANVRLSIYNDGNKEDISYLFESKDSRLKRYALAVS